jgi:divalent metal cation (Fe/Co/Zn/Cd) transporter
VAAILRSGRVADRAVRPAWLRPEHPARERSGSRPGDTTAVGGILWRTATLIAMLLLAWGKGVTGRRLGNPVLQTESHVTLIEALLAAAVLVGLVLNALLRWWWADPLSGLVIVYYALKEGWAAWHGEDGE